MINFIPTVKFRLGLAQSAIKERDELALLLFGTGIEIGAHSKPLTLAHNKKIKKISYVDRWTKDESLRLFPELIPIADDIVETDVYCEVINGLQPFSDASFEFVIANHIVEHMPDPIFLLCELRRVLRLGGRLFLSLPDMRFSGFDSARPLTLLAHIVDDYNRMIRGVEDFHLEEFLRLTENVDIPEDSTEREELFAKHRDRSIHVHIWNYDSFVELLLYIIQRHANFNVLATSYPTQNERKEMIFVLEACDPCRVDIAKSRSELRRGTAVGLVDSLTCPQFGYRQ